MKSNAIDNLPAMCPVAIVELDTTDLFDGLCCPLRELPNGDEKDFMEVFKALKVTRRPMEPPAVFCDCVCPAPV